RLAAHLDLALVRKLEPGEQVEQRGLARPRGPGHDREPAALEPALEAREDVRRRRAVTVRLREPADDGDRLAGMPRLSGGLRLLGSPSVAPRGDDDDAFVLQRSRRPA